MSHEEYFDDGDQYDGDRYVDEYTNGFWSWRRGYVIASVLATLFIVGGIAYGGYRVYERGKPDNRVQDFQPDYRIVGQQLAVEEKFESAADVFESLYTENSNDLASRSWYGCCQNALGNYALAEEVLRSIPFQRIQGPEQNRYFLACVCASQGKDEEALQFMWEYLLMGGIYPRPDNTFKVAHQLADLEASGKIQELLDKPQLVFRRIYGRKAAHNQSHHVVGHVRTSVERAIPVVKMEFTTAWDNEVDTPWALVCHLDEASQTWHAKFMQDNAAFGEFEGNWVGDRLRLEGRWIPATGGDEIPALLQMRFDPANPRQTDFFLFKSYDKSGDWRTAEYSIYVYLADG